MSRLVIEVAVSVKNRRRRRLKSRCIKYPIFERDMPVNLTNGLKMFSPQRILQNFHMIYCAKKQAGV